MSVNLITKEAIASTLESLLLERQFSKIPVKDVTEACGITGIHSIITSRTSAS